MKTTAHWQQGKKMCCRTGVHTHTLLYIVGLKVDPTGAVMRPFRWEKDIAILSVILRLVFLFFDEGLFYKGRRVYLLWNRAGSLTGLILQLHPLQEKRYCRWSGRDSDSIISLFSRQKLHSRCGGNKTNAMRKSLIHTSSRHPHFFIWPFF